MTNEIINKMVDEINLWIKLANDEDRTCGRTAWYKRTVDRIDGMCSMLTIVTGKVVVWDKNGVNIRDEMKVF